MKKHASLTLGGLRWGDVMLAIYRATHGTVCAIGVVIRNVTSIHPGSDFVLPTLSGVRIIVLANDFGSATQITNAKLFRGQHLLAASSAVTCDPLTPFCPIPPRHQFTYDEASQVRQLQLGIAQDKAVAATREAHYPRRRSLSNAGATEIGAALARASLGGTIAAGPNGERSRTETSADSGDVAVLARKLDSGASGDNARCEVNVHNAVNPHIDTREGLLRSGCVKHKFSLSPTAATPPSPSVRPALLTSINNVPPLAHHVTTLHRHNPPHHTPELTSPRHNDKTRYGLHEVTNAHAVHLEGHVVVTGAMEHVDQFVDVLRIAKMHGTVLHKPILLLHPFKRDSAASNAKLRRLASKLAR